MTNNNESSDVRTESVYGCMGGWKGWKKIGCGCVGSSNDRKRATRFCALDPCCFKKRGYDWGDVLLSTSVGELQFVQLRLCTHTQNRQTTIWSLPNRWKDGVRQNKEKRQDFFGRRGSFRDDPGHSKKTTLPKTMGPQRLRARRATVGPHFVRLSVDFDWLFAPVPVLCSCNGCNLGLIYLFTCR